MKSSIKLKLFLGICGLSVFFVLMSWVLNNKYLEEYYLAQKKETLSDIGESINNVYTGDIEDIMTELERIESSTGVNITIYNIEEGIKYSLYSRIINKKPIISRQPLISDLDDRIRLRLREIAKRKGVFQYQKDPRLEINYLNYSSILKNGDLLVLRIPLTAISENADIANDFMMFTGILIIIIGSIWAFVFSQKFTKPILEVNSIAQDMANLNFTKKCIIKNDDEIGELGKSINHLSLQLDNAISELNQKNEKLKIEIEKERRIDQLRKEFISSVSHELKTPISLILGYAEGLRDNVNNEEESKNFYCDVIVDEADKMDNLVKDLLNLSQIESGFFKIERKDFLLDFFITRVVSKFRTVLEEKGIVVNIENQEEIMVNGDIVRIEQILVNYINNAINHVDENKMIKIIYDVKPDKVKISVFNTGLNIPEDAIEKIWTSFYKVDKARTREYGGYGLGLSIVRAIQNLHHNSYGVLNVENGVLFWFEIDRA